MNEPEERMEGEEPSEEEVEGEKYDGGEIPRRTEAVPEED